MRRTAPGFLSVRPSDWNGSQQPYDAEQMGIENRHRRAALTKVAGIDVRETRIDDVLAFELVTKEQVESKIRMFTLSKDQAAILVTPDTCPHVVAVDHCKNHQFTTEIKLADTVKCIGPYSVGDHLLIAFEPNLSQKQRLEPGKVLAYSGKQSTFFLFDPEGRKLGQATPILNDFTAALPDEVISILALGTAETPASRLYNNVPESLRTKKLEQRVKIIRIAVAKNMGRNISASEGALPFTKTTLNAGLPGDEEVSKIIRDSSINAAAQLSKPAEAARGIYFLEAIRHFKGTDSDLAATGFEAKFGPWFADGTITSEADRNTFESLFPDSRYTKAVEETNRKQAEKSLAESKANQQAQSEEADFEAMAEVVGQIATLRQQSSFATQHANLMRNPRRGLAAAQAVRAEADRLQREDFCKAKREFLKSYGAKDFQNRAKEHCETDPPTGTAEFGREVRLDKECRTIFASGC